jgi:serine phosphatase RsbU (regulator of sigma subunit)
MTGAGAASFHLQPAVLTVINPSGQRSRVFIDRSPFLIGRQADNHLVLRDNRVSRVHAQIVREDTGYFIEDLNSRHGVYVNGERIQAKRQLFHSDSVSFGFADGYQLIFLQEEREIGRLVDHVASTSKSVAGLGSNLAKLRALVEVARALQSSLSIQEVLESVVDAALVVTGSERGFLLLRHGATLKVEVARNRDGVTLPADDLKVPTQLIARALDSRRELLSMHFDPEVEGAAKPDSTIARLDLRSVVCVPLVKIKTEVSANTIIAPVNETVGLIYLDSKSELADLSAGNREILQTLALEASTVLENARLLEQERAKQRLEEELRIARSIQQGLLPRELPSTGWFQVAGASVASQQVGGDYYDVARSAGDVWSLVVADVSGKGVSSALLASLLQGAFLVGAGSAEGIEAMLERINRYLYERTEGEKYATVFYCSVHRDGTVHWANAGHCPPILLRAGGGREMWRPTAMPVGILDIGRFAVQTSRLMPGDRLVIYSDGLSEAQNAAGEFFEQKRIDEVLRQGEGLGASALHAALFNAVNAFIGGVPQRDDLTLVIAEYNPEDERVDAGA